MGRNSSRDGYLIHRRPLVSPPPPDGQTFPPSSLTSSIPYQLPKNFPKSSLSPGDMTSTDDFSHQFIPQKDDEEKKEEEVENEEEEEVKDSA